MANTYTQIHLQMVFAVQNRQSLIQKEWQEELYKYITGIVQNNNHKMLQVNGMPDHIHLFINRKKTFTEEYLDFLKAFEMEYDDRFVFQPVL